MDIFDFFCNKKSRISQKDLESIVSQIVQKMRLVRELFMDNYVIAVKNEASHSSTVSPMLQAGSNLDSAIKGFQLTNIVGFSWKYMQLKDCLPFDKLLRDSMACGDVELIMQYNDKYLDRRGNTELLTAAFTEDLYSILGCPKPGSVHKSVLSRETACLGILSQANVARIFGDLKTEKRLFEHLSPCQLSNWEECNKSAVFFESKGDMILVEGGTFNMGSNDGDD